jgi:hypothetical protein
MIFTDVLADVNILLLELYDIVGQGQSHRQFSTDIEMYCECYCDF